MSLIQWMPVIQIRILIFTHRHIEKAINFLNVFALKSVHFIDPKLIDFRVSSAMQKSQFVILNFKILNQSHFECVRIHSVWNSKNLYASFLFEALRIRWRVSGMVFLKESRKKAIDACHLEAISILHPSHGSQEAQKISWKFFESLRSKTSDLEL